jgi:hypothetical protein
MQVRAIVGGRGDTHTQPSGSFEGRQLAVGVHGTEQGGKKVGLGQGLGRGSGSGSGSGSGKVVRVLVGW